MSIHRTAANTVSQPPITIEDATMTDVTAKDRIRMTVGEARALGEAAMRGAGHDEDDARILTDHVLDAALKRG
jgi:hypothetical protein